MYSSPVCTVCDVVTPVNDITSVINGEARVFVAVLKMSLTQETPFLVVKAEKPLDVVAYIGSGLHSPFRLLLEQPVIVITLSVMVEWTHEDAATYTTGNQEYGFPPL